MDRSDPDAGPDGDGVIVDFDHPFRYDPHLLMEVEILFEELTGGGTRVSLEHRNLEQLGVEAEAFAGKVRSGWPERMGNFAQFAASHA